MFWFKKSTPKPATVPAADAYSASALEKGTDGDRRSSFSSSSGSSSGSSAGSPIKEYPTLPQAAHLNGDTRSQTQSVDECSSVGTQSFPVISTNGHGRSRASRGPPNWFQRHWFALTLCLLFIIGTSVVVAVVIMKHNKADIQSTIYLPASQATGTLPDYWSTLTDYVVEDGTTFRNAQSTPSAS